MWGIVAWGVVPAGAFLVACYMSSTTLLVGLAKMVLSTPVKLHNFTISLPTFMIAICGVLAVVSHSSVQRYESIGDNASPMEGLLTPSLQDRHNAHKFYHGRNLWLSSCGLSLWIVAWRLHALKQGGGLVVPEGRSPSRFFGRIVWLSIAVVGLLLADIPLCRINYNVQLASTVTPVKEHLLYQFSEPCLDATEQSATGQCADFCRRARELSEERLEAVLWVRKWHLFGRWAAEMFDTTRGVEQGQERINDLVGRKTCLQVVESVDKSNFNVNAFCIFLTALCTVGAVSAFTAAIGVDVMKRGQQKVD
jgi:hypothetical protein